MQVQIRLDDIGLGQFIRREIEQTERMDEARIGAIQKLRFEAPVETGGFRVERALEGDDRLVEQRFIGPIGEEMAEVLIVRGTRAIEGDATFHPAVNLEAWLRCGWCDFFGLFGLLAVPFRSGEGRGSETEGGQGERAESCDAVFGHGWVFLGICWLV